MLASEVKSRQPSPPTLTSHPLHPHPQVFRIGHLGNMNELMLASALSGAEMAMVDAGMDIKMGSGVSKALEYWQKTIKVIPTRESLVE